MAGMNFAQKGLRQTLFSKKAVRATAGRKSSAMRTILGDKDIAKVIDKAAEKRVFYNALQKRGKEAGSRGITKNELKKVLGDIEHSGEFSHREIHILGEKLIGGASSNRIIREHASSNANQEKPKVDMQKIYQEIIDKRKPNIIKSSPDKQKNTSAGKLDTDAQKKDNPAPVAVKVSSSGVIANNLHYDQQPIIIKKESNYPSLKNSASVADYIKNHQNNESDTESIKDRLARIQGQTEPDKKYKKTELDV